MSGFIVELPADLSSPGEARHALAAEFVGRGVSLDRASVETAMLVVSELVTNAIVHGSCPIRLIVDLSDDPAERPALSLAVTDSSNELPAVGRHATAGQIGGWGLELVDRVSLSWGVLAPPDDQPGKIVWAHLQL